MTMILSLVLYVISAVLNVLAGIAYKEDLRFNANQRMVAVTASTIGVIKWILRGLPKT